MDGIVSRPFGWAALVLEAGGPLAVDAAHLPQVAGEVAFAGEGGQHRLGQDRGMVHGKGDGRGEGLRQPFGYQRAGQAQGGKWPLAESAQVDQRVMAVQAFVVILDEDPPVRHGVG